LHLNIDAVYKSFTHKNLAPTCEGKIYTGRLYSNGFQEYGVSMCAWQKIMVADCCERGNETPGFIKGRNVFTI
jgi:hypothetical protein